MHNYIASGFPSPAEDYLKPNLDLNAHLISCPAATFFMRSDTSVLKEYGIFRNDILIVDKAETLTKKSIAAGTASAGIAVVEGEIVIVPYYQLRKREAQIWGVATSVIHRL
jgi:DNA polymerase V